MERNAARAAAARNGPKVIWAWRELIFIVTARFGAVGKMLADARGSDRSFDPKGVIFSYCLGTKTRALGAARESQAMGPRHSDFGGDLNRRGYSLDGLLQSGHQVLRTRRGKPVQGHFGVARESPHPHHDFGQREVCPQLAAQILGVGKGEWRQG